VVPGRAYVTARNFTLGGRVINQDELAICKRRGHVPEFGVQVGWTQCKWCGMWLREVRKTEEREDDPPEDDKSLYLKLPQR
jgi:hypothetical protein